MAAKNLVFSPFAFSSSGMVRDSGTLQRQPLMIWTDLVGLPTPPDVVNPPPPVTTAPVFPFFFFAARLRARALYLAAQRQPAGQGVARGGARTTRPLVGSRVGGPSVLPTRSAPPLGGVRRGHQDLPLRRRVGQRGPRCAKVCVLIGAAPEGEGERCVDVTVRAFAVFGARWDGLSGSRLPG